MPYPIRTPSEHPQLLTLLHNRKTLWALIACWPNVIREDGWTDTKEGRARVATLWAQMAGVPEMEVRANWNLLTRNGFVLPDGGIDPLAETYVRGQVMDQLPRLMRRKAAEAAEHPAGAADPLS